MSRAGERERIVAGTERGDLLIVEAGELRLALLFENAPAIDAILATPKAPPSLRQTLVKSLKQGPWASWLLYISGP